MFFALQKELEKLIRTTKENEKDVGVQSARRMRIAKKKAGALLAKCNQFGKRKWPLGKQSAGEQWHRAGVRVVARLENACGSDKRPSQAN